MVGITKKSIELSRKVNGAISKWPTSKLNRFLSNDSAQKAEEEGEAMFYNDGPHNNIGITKKSIALSKKVNGAIAKWPTSKLNKFLNKDSAQKAEKNGENLFYK